MSARAERSAAACIAAVHNLCMFYLFPKVSCHWLSYNVIQRMLAATGYQVNVADCRCSQAP